MKSSASLVQLAQGSRKLLSGSLLRKRAFSSEMDTEITATIFKIKDNLSASYCTRILAKENEWGVLEKLVGDYIRTGTDNFDRHYIQLLCWNIHRLKVIPVKGDRKTVKVSFLEYQPSLFDIAPATKKLFKLLEKYAVCKERLATALMMVYLDNYHVSSGYFSDLLKKYLRSIKAFRNLNVFFDVTKAGTYRTLRNPSSFFMKLFLQRMNLLKVRSSYLDCKYFQDAWYFWMRNTADVTDAPVLENMQCSYFDICTDEEKLLILARILVKNDLKGKDIKALYEAILKDLFPRNPAVPENWIFSCDKEDFELLVKANNIFQRRFFAEKQILTCKSIGNKINVYSHKEI